MKPPASPPSRSSSTVPNWYVGNRIHHTVPAARRRERHGHEHRRRVDPPSPRRKHQVFHARKHWCRQFCIRRSQAQQRRGCLPETVEQGRARRGGGREAGGEGGRGHLNKVRKKKEGRAVAQEGGNGGEGRWHRGRTGEGLVEQDPDRTTPALHQDVGARGFQATMILSDFVMGAIAECPILSDPNTNTNTLGLRVGFGFCKESRILGT